MGGHAPSASDWHRGKVPGFEQVHGAPQKGDVASDGEHVGIVSRPGKTGAGGREAGPWAHLAGASTNQELHKGVEFGVKAAPKQPSKAARADGPAPRTGKPDRLTL